MARHAKKCRKPSAFSKASGRKPYLRKEFRCRDRMVYNIGAFYLLKYLIRHILPSSSFYSTGSRWCKNLMPSAKVKRQVTREGIELRDLEGSDYSLNSSVCTQTCRSQCTAKINHFKNIQIPWPCKETSDPSLYTVIISYRLCRDWISAFILSDRTSLDKVPEREGRRERIEELDDTKGCNYWE